MNTRSLTTLEQTNLDKLREAGLDCALLFLTSTGLAKSIMDAVVPLRTLLRESGVHDYSKQPQGEGAKVRLATTLFSNERRVDCESSLYRPLTKQGDPRIWIYGLAQHAEPNDVLALATGRGGIAAFNLTRLDIQRAPFDAPVRQYLGQVALEPSAAMELLALLRQLANRGPLRAVCRGDTAIGRTLETALGISINSSKLPDFKGIEIKSGRSSAKGKRENRASLFACVPNWTLSAYKSSRQILERFGYDKGRGFRLYCTVSARAPNSQLLQLELDTVNEWLREFAAKNPKEQVAIWPLDTLHAKLREKHKETFWIKAKSEVRNKNEYFTLTSVRHTKSPSIVSFDSLLDEGSITVDHLIKRKRSGGAIEKGPLFKIQPHRVSDLFVFPTRQYALSEQ